METQRYIRLLAPPMRGDLLPGEHISRAVLLNMSLPILQRSQLSRSDAHRPVPFDVAVATACDKFSITAPLAVSILLTGEAAPEEPTFSLSSPCSYSAAARRL
jgi:hypothetical protein